MSGIVAIKNNFNKADVEKMLDKLHHRGPDDTHLYQKGDYFIGEKVLASEFSSQDSNTEMNKIMAIDGEPLLHDTFITKDKLLDLYEKEGPEFVSYLGNGFSLILLENDRIFVARDTFGRKPLYYAIDDNGNFHFASEMKALRDYFNNIEIFPPGSYYTEQAGIQSFSSVPLFHSNIKDDPGSKDYYEKAAKLNYLMTKAVSEAWKEAKDPAVFLSGGVDSSVVAVALANLTDKKINTFAVGTENSEDILNARKVSEYIQSHHVELTYNKDDMFEVLPEVIYYLESFDVELVNSSIANFLVSKLAKEHGFDVVLSGEGADELFGGYHHLKDCKTDTELNEALEGLLRGLHNGGLQRVDRMTSAHSLNCRMPFLHHKIINFAKRIPCDWKISRDGMEKLLLRQAFDGDLPSEVLWRKKAQFGIGSGNEKTMEQVIDSEISDDEFNEDAQRYDLKFKSKEEYYYFKIFEKFFPGKGVIKNVNRWLV
ncbi:asparagine synthase-related protein [Natranaerobius trueperi]|uniref:asparagine synthase (glutamine-hydrolyzing) n=1 Tax=Natranaerobius trueperi TaxID=759412 RepID=A0A226BX04_9FIRM|nr:asparagine synthase-related protein [Natranaerobius trueperi]OWZ82660.1 asparagine synthase [Natranaerobius trueperi]